MGHPIGSQIAPRDRRMQNKLESETRVKSRCLANPLMASFNACEEMDDE
jgi:hypothetical protein